VDVSDTSWPACIDDAEFLVSADGSVQLSSVGEPGSQTANVCLSPTQRTFTARFLAKIGGNSISQSSRNSAVSKGEVFWLTVKLVIIGHFAFAKFRELLGLEPVSLVFVRGRFR